MLKGLNLTLMIGPGVPVPVPRPVLEALTELSVTQNDTTGSNFQLSFSFEAHSPLLNAFLISSGYGGGNLFPIVRVMILVTHRGTPTVLMDGVITNYEIKPAGTTNKTLLTFTGDDLSVLMNKLEVNMSFPALPAEGRVTLLLAKYLALGITPLVIPSLMLDVPIPTARLPFQNATDLTYIRYLAEKVGYVFYVEPGPQPGMSIAYWGPQIKVGVPQPALSINMDIHTNVESLSFNFDNSKNEIPTYFYYDEQTKAIMGVPIPPVTPINPPLGLIPPIPLGFRPVSNDLAKFSIAEGLMRGIAKAAKLTEAVTGSGELDVVRYGHILKAGKLVGVRGMGFAYDGLYYVTSVTHKIKRGEYKQSFSLSRNGLVSTVPRVQI